MSELSPYAKPVVTDDELNDLEGQIQEAQRRRSLDGLTALGFGEVSIAIGWPTGDPRFVAKRLIPLADQARIDGPLADIDNAIATVRERGCLVLPTETRRITRADGLYVAYVVQPVVAREHLAETTLEQDQPEVDHPLLVAVRDFAMACATDRYALDSQIPNFAWVDGKLWLIDVTSPLTFDEAGKLTWDTHMAKQMIPALLRPALQKMAQKIASDYLNPHGSLTQTVVFLKRIGADAWVEPAIETFNQTLDQPIDPEVVEQRWAQNVKDFPRIKNMLKLQRAWQEKVRRRPYEYLITDSFSGEIL